MTNLTKFAQVLQASIPEKAKTKAELNRESLVKMVVYFRSEVTFGGTTYRKQGTKSPKKIYYSHRSDTEEERLIYTGKFLTTTELFALKGTEEHLALLGAICKECGMCLHRVAFYANTYETETVKHPLIIAFDQQQLAEAFAQSQEPHEQVQNPDSVARTTQA